MFDFGSLISGIGSFFGSQETAEGYEEAAKFYREAGRITLLSGRLKNRAIRQQTRQLAGTTRANQGASGLSNTGSFKDVIRSNVQQGFLTKTVNTLNTNLQYKQYMSQAAQADANANAAEWGGIGGLVGGTLGFFSDDRLKEDVKLVGRRPDGLGIYYFRFGDQPGVYEGVLASEVRALYPDAVSKKNGYDLIDYSKIGVEFKQVQDA